MSVSFPAEIGAPHLRAVHAQLARQAEQLRELIEGRVGARLVEREEVHQVEMALVIAADVVVVAELAVVLAACPSSGAP